MDSLTFLERGGGRGKPQPVYVLHGDEYFLKRHVLALLRKLVLGEGDDAFGFTSLPGDKASFSEVYNELSTLPFLAPRRLVAIEQADPFVTRERERLEKYVAAPAEKGVLVLDVASWPGTTRLARALTDSTIVCKAPASHRLPEWCVQWAAARHGKELAAQAARLLVDLVGPDMGLLDQELTKLAVYAGDAKRIESADVDRLVGNNREQNTWKVFDFIGAGDGRGALELMDRLFAQGEEPMRLLGAFSLQLRRLAQVARLAGQGTSLTDALEQAGVPSFGRKATEQQLRHLGRRRLDRLYDWLLQTDLGLKGGSQLPPRTLLERLVVQLARPAK
jgi:DNA polymerase-3 subunit delta